MKEGGFNWDLGACVADLQPLKVIITPGEHSCFSKEVNTSITKRSF